MGPRLDGVSHETGWSTDWPDEGLSRIWTKEVGIGFSSVSVVDGRLYTMGHADGQEAVWCLDEKTGEEIWSHQYPAELNANLYDGGPGATPTIHGDYAYTLSVDGRALCLQRKTGQVIWQRDLKDDLNVDMHEWGFNASPYILDDNVLFQGGRLVAYDKLKGDLVWRSEEHRAGYGSVRAFSHNGRLLLANLDCDGLRISNASDGSLVAFQEWKSPFGTNSTTPIVVNDMIYISSGYNVGCALFQLTKDDASDSDDTLQLQQVYVSKRMRNHFNNSILFEGHLYGLDGNSNLGRVVTLTCMDFSTGEVRWKERGLGCGSLMIADGKLVILSEDGLLVVAKASPDSYQEIARSEFLSGRCWTMPLLLNGRVFGRNAAGRLVCAGLPADR
ncbi:MAG: PQQ-binding-like beta-propeller repeat protein [Fuerstiella sp.]|nr:PQQ-binding-like beta-propeller repeat protein [Fuerstiella sp.]MCP4857802.1 PQQ-binding-like beta-propeller repeat protein [Fuerstiella sp.]